MKPMASLRSSLGKPSSCGYCASGKLNRMETRPSGSIVSGGMSTDTFFSSPESKHQRAMSWPLIVNSTRCKWPAVASGFSRKWSVAPRGLATRMINEALAPFVQRPQGSATDQPSVRNGAALSSVERNDTTLFAGNAGAGLSTSRATPVFPTTREHSNTPLMLRQKWSPSRIGRNDRPVLNISSVRFETILLDIERSLVAKI